MRENPRYPSQELMQQVLAAGGTAGVDDNGAWPHVLRPEWIYVLLRQWQRQQPLQVLLEQATATTAQEQPNPDLRRSCLTWIASIFIPTLRRAGVRATLKQNLWASYSHSFEMDALAPIWLARFTGHQMVAHHAAMQWRDLLEPGFTVNATMLNAGELENGVWRPDFEFFLRSLQHWGVLAPTETRGDYRVVGRLRVKPALFPLLVYTQWLWRHEPVMSLHEFRRSPLMTWLDPTDFAIGWDTFAGQMWTLEEHDGEFYAHLRPLDHQSFVRHLLNLLSTDGRRGRQKPRYSSGQVVEITPPEAIV